MERIRLNDATIAYQITNVADQETSHRSQRFLIKMKPSLLLSVFLAAQLFPCILQDVPGDEECEGYVNNSQFTNYFNDNFAIVVRVESGTRLKFFGRHNYSNCQNGTFTAINWRAGIIPIRIHYEDYNVTPSYIATNESKVCISEMTLIATSGSLRQPRSNTFYFEENNIPQLICLPGHSIARYFVILIKDDLSECNNTSSMATSGWNASTATINESMPATLNISRDIVTTISIASENLNTTIAQTSVQTVRALLGSSVVLVVIVGVFIIIMVILSVFLQRLTRVKNREENESYVNTNESTNINIGTDTGPGMDDRD